MSSQSARIQAAHEARQHDITRDRYSLRSGPRGAELDQEICALCDLQRMEGDDYCPRCNLAVEIRQGSYEGICDCVCECRRGGDTDDDSSQWNVSWSSGSDKTWQTDPWHETDDHDFDTDEADSNQDVAVELSEVYRIGIPVNDIDIHFRAFREARLRWVDVAEDLVDVNIGAVERIYGWINILQDAIIQFTDALRNEDILRDTNLSHLLGYPSRLTTDELGILNIDLGYGRDELMRIFPEAERFFAPYYEPVLARLPRRCRHCSLLISVHRPTHEPEEHLVRGLFRPDVDTCHRPLSRFDDSFPSTGGISPGMFHRTECRCECDCPDRPDTGPFYDYEIESDHHESAPDSNVMTDSSHGVQNQDNQHRHPNSDSTDSETRRANSLDRRLRRLREHLRRRAETTREPPTGLRDVLTRTEMITLRRARLIFPDTSDHMLLEYIRQHRRPTEVLSHNNAILMGRLGHVVDTPARNARVARQVADAALPARNGGPMGSPDLSTPDFTTLTGEGDTLHFGDMIIDESVTYDDELSF